MAFIKLFPPQGGDALPVADIVRRLRDEFAVLNADPDQGQDHVASMIAATLRFSDAVPGKQERLNFLQSVQDAAVRVTFGDALNLTASCCLIPHSELCFGSPDEVDGPARPLVERAAIALGYELCEG
jgi:hypothetical protein